MPERDSLPLLVIEDSDEDFEMLQILMEDLEVDHPVYRCATGDKALEFIEQQSAEAQSNGKPALSWQDSIVGSNPAAAEGAQKRVRPSIILLDLNLPGVDGREVLAQLKQNQQLKEVPVIIFTTSSDPSDIQHCYQNGANGYLIKPVGVEQLEKKVKAFVDYWLGANTLPTWDAFNPAV